MLPVFSRVATGLGDQKPEGRPVPLSMLPSCPKTSAFGTKVLVGVLPGFVCAIQRFGCVIGRHVDSPSGLCNHESAWP